MRVDKLHEYFQALMPKPSVAHKKFYEKQWDPSDYLDDLEDENAHVHDEKRYFVNPNELNLYVDKAQNQMGLMI